MALVSAAAAVIVALSLPAFATAQNPPSSQPPTVDLQVQPFLPDEHSDFVDPSFAGFGIEPSNLFSFTGYDKPNQLTFNLIDNLVNYTGVPPHIRMGGNTQDYMIYSEDQDQYAWVNNSQFTGQGALPTDGMIIGPRFFEVVNRFPRGTPITWGLNLAYSAPDYRDRIALMAQQVVDRVTNLKLVSFEIGNEPDLYNLNGFRSGPWGGGVYAREWLDRAQVVYDRVLKPLNTTAQFFEPGATANTFGTSFDIDEMVTLGIETRPNGSDASSFVASWNQHDYYYFVGVTPNPLLLEEFLDFQTTNAQFLQWEQSINKSKATPYPYALREMCSAGPVGLANITDTLAGALWTLNFFLYAATLNITTVQMHMTDNSAASPWQPVQYGAIQPYVRPLYYGFAAFDQIIGPGCTTQISTLDIGQPRGYEGKVRAYTVYQSGNLSSVVLLNGRLTNSTDSPGSVNFTLNLDFSLAGQTLHLSYLTGPSSTAKHNTTWNGISYESPDTDGRPVVVDPTDRTVRVAADGTATLTLRDSEALAATLGSPLGSPARQPDRVACAAIAARSPGLGGGDSRPGPRPPLSSSSSANNNNKNNNNRNNGTTSTNTTSPVAPTPTATTAQGLGPGSPGAGTPTPPTTPSGASGLFGTRSTAASVAAAALAAVVVLACM